MESNNINFDDKWQKTVLELLSTEKDLWIDMEIDENYLYVDFLQISLDTYNNLHLSHWIPLNQTISDKNILEFCNQQKYVFPKVYFDDVTESFNKKSICLDLMIPTDGGVSAEALQKIVELFWLDMIRIESKVSEIGWLEEDRVSEDDFIGGKGEESDDFLDEITTNEDEEKHSEIEDKLVSVEDALDDLKAEFAKIMGEEELSGEE